MNVPRLLLCAATGALLGGAGLLAKHSGAAPAAALEEPGAPTQEDFPLERKSLARFPNPELITHDGRKVRFYDDLVRDKTVAISFFYVECTGF